QGRPVRGREVVGHAQLAGRGQLEDGFGIAADAGVEAKVARLREAVARGEVEVELAVHPEPAAALPNAGGVAVGGGVEELLQRQVAGPVADDPAVVRAVVPVGRPGDVHGAVGQGQGGALAFAERVEAQGGPVAADAGAGHGHAGRVRVAAVRAADGGVADRRHAVGRPVQAGGDVERVQPLHVVGDAV